MISEGKILRDKKEAVFIYNPDTKEAGLKSKEEGKE